MISSGHTVTTGKNSGLRPWKKGQSGNPTGRPKSVVVHLREEILELCAKRYQGSTRLKVLVRRLYEEDPKTFLAYGFGKPVETYQLQGPQGESVIKPEVLAAAIAVAKAL
jgi:hypothetical protein